MELDDMMCQICCVQRRKTHHYLCVNSHTICKICFDKLDSPKVCPYGSCSYPSPPMRNRTLEELLDRDHLEPPGMRQMRVSFSTTNFDNLAWNFDQCVNLMKVECKYNEDGCIYTGRPQTLDDHEMECRHRKVPCPEGRCNEEVKFDSLIRHIYTNHKNAKKVQVQVLVHPSKRSTLLPLESFH